MSRKHFERIAAAMRRLMDDPKIQRSPVAKAAVTATITEIADVCSSCNDRFDRGRFLSACGQ